jgi:hypothetical protein
MITSTCGREGGGVAPERGVAVGREVGGVVACADVGVGTDVGVGATVGAEV